MNSTNQGYNGVRGLMQINLKVMQLIPEFLPQFRFRAASEQLPEVEARHRKESRYTSREKMPARIIQVEHSLYGP